jgi:hypothetical protein
MIHRGDREAGSKNRFSLPEQPITEQIITEQIVTEQINGAAIEMQREFRPGLVESADEEGFCHELHRRDMSFLRQVGLAIAHPGLKPDCDGIS